LQQEHHVQLQQVHQQLQQGCAQVTHSNSLLVDLEAKCASAAAGSVVAVQHSSPALRLLQQQHCCAISSCRCSSSGSSCSTSGAAAPSAAAAGQVAVFVQLLAALPAVCALQQVVFQHQSCSLLPASS
jgi:hypothetical protein